MPSINIDHQLIPPSLLPILHDCVHHRPPLWFAELEELYRNVDNLPSLSRSLDPAYIDLQKRELRTGVVQRVKKRVFGPKAEARRSYSTSRYTQTDYLLGQRYYRWMMLADARAVYIAHKVSGTDGSEPARLAAMGRLEDAADKALEAAMAELPVLGLTAAQLTHLATLDVYLPPASADNPPSSLLPLRPSSVSHCWLFHVSLSSACRAGMRLTEAHQHLGERVGGGKEAEWKCAAYAISEESRQERLLQLEEYK